MYYSQKDPWGQGDQVDPVDQLDPGIKHREIDDDDKNNCCFFTGDVIQKK